MPSPPPSGDHFPRLSEADWRALAAASIGEPNLDGLVSRSADDFPVGPIYVPGDRPSLPGRAGPWTIVQRWDGDDPDAAANAVRDDLAGGVGAIELVFATSPVARSVGLPASPGTLGRVLRHVPRGALRVTLDAGGETPRLATEALTARPAHLAVAFDPSAGLASASATPPLDAAFDAILTVSESAGAGALSFTARIADGRPWHDAGATPARELAAVLAAFVAWLRHGESVSRLHAAAAMAEVAIVADQDQFMSIAKVRAMRLLLGRVLELAGLADVRPSIHVETSSRLADPRDPDTGLIRLTSAVFAAGVGGADSITALPSGASTDPFARRMARNVQLILAEESQLGRVADPGAGSGAIEALSDALAEAAWNGFRAIEAKGNLAGARDVVTGQRA